MGGIEWVAWIGRVRLFLLLRPMITKTIQTIKFILILLFIYTTPHNRRRRSGVLDCPRCQGPGRRSCNFCHYLYSPSPSSLCPALRCAQGERILPYYLFFVPVVMASKSPFSLGVAIAVALATCGCRHDRFSSSLLPLTHALTPVLTHPVFLPPSLLSSLISYLHLPSLYMYIDKYPQFFTNGF